jgi:hypothetical protein
MNVLQRTSRIYGCRLDRHQAHTAASDQPARIHARTHAPAAGLVQPIRKGRLQICPLAYDTSSLLARRPDRAGHAAEGCPRIAIVRMCKPVPCWSQMKSPPLQAPRQPRTMPAMSSAVSPSTISARPPTSTAPLMVSRVRAAIWRWGATSCRLWSGSYVRGGTSCYLADVIYHAAYIQQGGWKLGRMRRKGMVRWSRLWTCRADLVLPKATWPCCEKYGRRHARLRIAVPQRCLWSRKVQGSRAWSLSQAVAAAATPDARGQLLGAPGSERDAGAAAARARVAGIGTHHPRL